MPSVPISFALTGSKLLPTKHPRQLKGLFWVIGSEVVLAPGWFALW